MSEGLDLGLDQHTNYDERGIPEPPRWLSEMVERGKLTLFPFDEDCTIALGAAPGVATVVLSSPSRTVSFAIGPVSFRQIVSMSKSLVSRGALADAKPLPAATEIVATPEALGDFQVFHFAPLRDGVGTCLYTRAVDQRNAVRLVFKNAEAVARFAVSLQAAIEIIGPPQFERLDVPYTVISDKNPVTTPEELGTAVRVVKSASGKGVSGLGRVGRDPFSMLGVPEGILAKFNDDGSPIKDPASLVKPIYALHPATWYVIVAVIAAAIAATLARVVF